MNSKGTKPVPFINVPQCKIKTLKKIENDSIVHFCNKVKKNILRYFLVLWQTGPFTNRTFKQPINNLKMPLKASITQRFRTPRGWLSLPIYSSASSHLPHF